QSDIRMLLQFGMLCNHAEIVHERGQYRLEGDPTEGAMVVAGMKAGFNRRSLLNDYTILQEFPFDSTRKRMTSIVEAKNGDRFAITKGAPDVLLGLSSFIFVGGRKEVLSGKWEKEVVRAMEELAGQALRTIAVAYKPIAIRGREVTEHEAERDLIFIGMEGMIDPPRPEVKAAIRECKLAGIKTVMITGDDRITAKAIGEELGLFEKDSIVLEGYQIDRMSVDELEEIVEKVSIFARVSPEHKLKIVKAFQNRGHIVAMTGDGVNDAPA